MRPDLPNNLGNANTWVSRAAAQGLATGSAPRVGAVGQQGMHVVYVEAVNGDGTVTISEMNHAGLYVRTVRTVPASTFMYIY
jgi:surface antigen